MIDKPVDQSGKNRSCARVRHIIKNFNEKTYINSKSCCKTFMLITDVQREQSSRPKADPWQMPAFKKVVAEELLSIQTDFMLSDK